MLFPFPTFRTPDPFGLDDLAQRQTRLPPEFERAIMENVEALYEQDEGKPKNEGKETICRRPKNIGKTGRLAPSLSVSTPERPTGGC